MNNKDEQTRVGIHCNISRLIDAAFGIFKIAISKPLLMSHFSIFSKICNLSYLPFKSPIPTYLNTYLRHSTKFDCFHNLVFHL